MPKGAGLAQVRARGGRVAIGLEGAELIARVGAVGIQHGIVTQQWAVGIQLAIATQGQGGTEPTGCRSLIGTVDVQVRVHPRDIGLVQVRVHPRDIGLVQVRVHPREIGLVHHVIPTPGQRRRVGHPTSLAGPARTRLTPFLKIVTQLITRITPGRGRVLLGITIGQPHLLAGILV